MFFNYKKLCNDLNKYQKIIIYGTGNYAKAVYPDLIKFGLKEKIICFTRTNESPTDTIDGIPVISIDMLSYDKKNYAILVAVGKMYVDEIRVQLKECLYSEIIFLIDYEISHVQYIQDAFLHAISFEEYCMLITDGHAQIRNDGIDKKIVMQNLLDRGKYAGQNVDSKLIVMICGHKSVRSNKIAGALVRKGYHLVILDYCFAEYSWCLAEEEKINVQSYKCHCIEEMLYKALQYRPLVYFFEPLWGDCSWAEIMIKQKNYFGKVIVALYDILNDGYSGYEKNKLETEKYVLENADGVVWRGFSEEYLEEKGFKFKGKSIQFLDYCSKVDESNFEIDEDVDILKLCEVTGIGDCYFEKKNNLGYVDYANLDEILEVLGNRKDCIFHFYTARLSEENFERGRQYEKRYKNFKIFVGIEHGELLKKLKEYDYGCDLYTSGEWASDNVVLNKHTGSLWMNGVRNIFFDYLSAGIPLITTAMKKFLDYMQPYDIAVKMNISNLDVEYLQQNKCFYRANVINVKKELDIDNQIDRLIHFFREV